MRVEYVAGATTTVMQQASTGFNGSYSDRASGTLGGITLTASRPGADINGFTVVSTAAGVAMLRDGSGKQLRQLKVATLTWTALAAAINADPSSGFNDYVRASVVTPGAISAQTATMASGADPVRDPDSGLYRYPTVANAGLFYFDQARPTVISGIYGNLPAGGSAAFTIEFVNLDAGLRPIADEGAPIRAATLPNAIPNGFAMTAVNAILQKRQAVRITCAAAGRVWITFRQESGAP